MKIYKNTHKGAPLQDAIDEYAMTDKARIAASRVDLWRRVKMHMAVKLRVEEKDITDKDLGLAVGLYVPNFSMNLPSLFARLSAATK